MIKKKTKVIIVIAIGVLFLGLIIAGIFYFPTRGQMVVGGGPGTSVSQVIEGVEMILDGDNYKMCIARPPVGETWLITSFVDDTHDCGLVEGDINNYIWKEFITDEVPDRIFIDNDVYLACGLYWGRACDRMITTGIRV